MRKYVVIAVLIICILGAGFVIYNDVHAQAGTTGQPLLGPPPGSALGPGGPGGPGGGRGQRMLARLTTELQLTSDEVAQIKPILADQRSKMTALRNDTTLSDDQRRSQIADLRKTTNAQIAAILTPDQAAKYQTIQAETRRQWGGGGPGGPGGGQWGGGAGGGGGPGGPGGPGGGGGAIGGNWGGPGT